MPHFAAINNKATEPKSISLHKKETKDEILVAIKKTEQKSVNLTIKYNISRLFDARV